MVKRLFTLTLISAVFCWGGQVASLEVDEPQLAGFFALVAQPQKIVDEIAKAVNVSRDETTLKKLLGSLHQSIEEIKQSETEQTPVFCHLLEELKNAVTRFEQVFYTEAPIINSLLSILSEQNKLTLKLSDQASSPAKKLTPQLAKAAAETNRALKEYLSTSSIPETLKVLQSTAQRVTRTMAIRGMTDDMKASVEGKPLAIVPPKDLEFFQAGFQTFTEGTEAGKYQFEGIRHSTLQLLFGGDTSTGIKATALARLPFMDRLKILREVDSLLPKKSFLRKLRSAYTAGEEESPRFFLRWIIKNGWLDNEVWTSEENINLISWLLDEYKVYLNKLDDDLKTTADYAAQDQVNRSKILEELQKMGAKQTYFIKLEKWGFSENAKNFKDVIEDLHQNAADVANKLILIKIRGFNGNNASDDIDKLALYNIVYLHLEPQDTNLLDVPQNTNLPQELTKLKKLKTLILRSETLYNNINNSNALNVIAQVASLENLKLSDYVIYGNHKELIQLKKLKKLDLSENFIAQDALRTIAQISSLKELNLRKCSLSDLPQELTNLKKLKKLVLTENKIELPENAKDIIQQLREKGVSVDEDLVF